MVVWSLNLDTADDGEEIMGPKFLYLSVVGELMFLTNCIKFDIVFVVDLLDQHNATPTKHYWTMVKHNLIYMNGTRYVVLFFKRGSISNMVGYTNDVYLSDLHNGKS